ncbi:uncharacterized protein LOC113768612 [Coffea eugenioides]|uniref:Ribosomal protein L34Ae n=1 Tax=Coffea arabica TaxID=13443 RepID=A0A6P6XCS6_COFAR|nr:uncharacterized protein LOC113741653 [Coffea arabica]XP_027168839.1 uncharacterized protein LOC113768612 [Coffea eugenioides]
MQCPGETIAGLFYNASSSFLLLFIFFYVTSILLAKLFSFLGGNLFFSRNQNEFEYGEFSDEEVEQENGYFHADSMQQSGPLEANILDGGETLIFMQDNSDHEDPTRVPGEEIVNPDEEAFSQECHEESYNSEELSVYSSAALESVHSDEAVGEEEIPPARDTDSSYAYQTNKNDPTSIRTLNQMKSGLIMDNKNNKAKCEEGIAKDEKKDATFTRDENFLVFAPSKRESKKLLQPEGKDEEDIFGDSCTVGSTSKSSSEWRSSNINYRDSGTDDPFSSSSRRSCPKWESYTVFQKYDEEMLFLDRISAQKLHETESLKSIQACPRSISDRIVYKLAAKNKSSSDFRRNPYHELEGTYVAQICWTWEALNWNYKYFQRLRAARREQDPGCPAYVAQQFQQFLVLLQRYVENEPYEHGKRPEIYARMRSLAPKLLQVPEYRDSEEEKKDEGSGARISSDSFLIIMEESIRTFMNFLKADKESRCQVLAAFFRRNRRGSADATLLLLLKKVNKKKKMKLKELRRSGKCLRRRRLRLEEEMEILMAFIDLKVVSRVLRMRELHEEQLHWCENKMSKVRVSDGKLQRDSSPLFFPAH